jgi:protein-disulfide isomerase
MTRKLAQVALALMIGGASISLTTIALLGPNDAVADTINAKPANERVAKAPAVPDMSIGNPAAKVQVIEYLSFTCPHCAEFHASVWPELKKNYIDTRAC